MHDYQLHHQRRIRIDLDGPNGNAFFLFGLAVRWAKQLDLDPDPIVDEMKRDHYDALIQTFLKHFNAYCELIRDGEVIEYGP